MSSLSLREWHEQLGGRFGSPAGAEIVSDYGEVNAEYRALTENAGVLDLSFRGRICLTGADRARFLHGQVTNEVKGLRFGEGCYAALITAKGKMESDLNIFCLKEETLLDFEPGLTARISERLEKFIIADDVHVVDVAPHYGLLAVNGPRAEEVIRAARICEEVPAKPLSFTTISDPQLGLIYVANNPRVGSAGFDVFVPMNTLGAVADKLIAATRTLGGGLCGWDAFEIARVEAGIPRFGQDMDESNIPLEAGLENRGISFSKGCYIGQEVISRIRTYGQVAKALRGLRLTDSAAPLPAKGDKLFKDGKEVGYVTSAVVSPKVNAKIALGYVRKEVNQIGTELLIKTGGLEFGAVVVTLPFGKS